MYYYFIDIGESWGYATTEKPIPETDHVAVEITEEEYNAAVAAIREKSEEIL